MLSSPTFSDARQKLQELTSAEEGFQKRKSQPVLTRKSTIVGDVASGASDLTSRIHNARNEIETRIPEVIASVEKDIATSNRDKVILALANFLGSKC